MAKKSYAGKMEHAGILLEKLKLADYNPKELGINQETIQELEALLKDVNSETGDVEKIKIQLTKKKENIKEKEKSIGRVLKDIRKMLKKDITKKVLKELGFDSK